MKDIIWTKDELKKIKRHVLTRANLTINDEGEIQKHNPHTIPYQEIHQYTYMQYAEEIEKLFYTDNKEEIMNLLTQISNLKFNSTTPHNIGFVTTLRRINPNDATEIFVVFKEIIGQYERITSRISQEFVNQCTTIEELIETSKKYTHTHHDETIQSEEFKMASNEINDLFFMCNGIMENNLFKPLLTKLNSTLQHRITAKVNLYTNQKVNRHFKTIENNNYNYQAETSRRLKKLIKKD